jgi:hypothetical protein
MQKIVVLSEIGVLAGSMLLGALSYREPPSQAKPNVCWVESKPIPNGAFNVVRCDEAKFG